MTGDNTLQCANCGQANPDWAKTCRSCAAPLIPAARFDGPPSRVPTDSASLMSIGAAAAAILVAVVIGLFLAGLDPTEPTVGLGTPTPEPTPTRTPRPTPSPTQPDDASPEPTPQYLGTLTFGTGLAGGGGGVTNPTSTFAPRSTFAWSVQMSEAWGTNFIHEVVVRVEPDGSETDLPQGGDLLEVNPTGRTIGFQVPTRELFDLWGEGDYVMRIRRCTGDTQETCTELVAQNTFTLVAD